MSRERERERKRKMRQSKFLQLHRFYTCDFYKYIAPHLSSSTTAHFVLSVLYNISKFTQQKHNPCHTQTFLFLTRHIPINNNEYY